MNISIKKLVSLYFDKTWTCLRKENRRRETESLLIAAQNNDIRNNFVKGKFDNKQQNRNCAFCKDKD